MKNSHGGTRKGAGRKPLPLSRRLIQTTVRLSPDEIQFLRSIDPSLSKAIRTLTRKASQITPAKFHFGKQESELGDGLDILAMDIVTSWYTAGPFRNHGTLEQLQTAIAYALHHPSV